jgi:hypothetical protein
MAGMEVDDGPTRPGSKRNFSRSGITRRYDGQQQQQVCRYWLEGRCNKGDDCNFLHANSDGSGPTGRPHSSNGAASKRPNNLNENRGGFPDGGGSGFQNQGGARRSTTSARWGRPRGSNNASTGNRTYNRVGTDGVRRPKDRVCNYWLKGNCTRGDDCNYLHAHSASPDISLIKDLAGHGKVRTVDS